MAAVIGFFVERHLGVDTSGEIPVKYDRGVLEILIFGTIQRHLGRVLGNLRPRCLKI